MLASKFSSLPHSLDNPQEWNGKIGSYLKKILEYALLLLCRWISYVQRWSIILLNKMFIVFYTVEIVYICAFMTVSTSYCMYVQRQFFLFCITKYFSKLMLRVLQWRSTCWYAETMNTDLSTQICFMVHASVIWHYKTHEAYKIAVALWFCWIFPDDYPRKKIL